LSTFAAGEEEWRARLGTLRQVVRQELVWRQLSEFVPDRPRRRVLTSAAARAPSSSGINKKKE